MRRPYSGPFVLLDYNSDADGGGSSWSKDENHVLCGIDGSVPGVCEVVCVRGDAVEVRGLIDG
jgi:hypothetical protein